MATLIRMACSPGSRLSGSELGSAFFNNPDTLSISHPNLALELPQPDPAESEGVNVDA